MTNALNKAISFFGIYSKEIILALLISSVTFFSVFTLYEEHQDILLHDGSDAYFEADTARTFNIMTDRKSVLHYRSSVHPLVSLQTYIPTFIIKNMGVSFPLAVKIVICFIASMWAIFLYFLFRVIGNNLIQSTLLTLLGLTSASGIFWLTIPESFALGSISIICTLLIAGTSHHKKLGEKYFVFINIFSFSVTITNWMAGIATTLATHKIKQTIKICFISLLIIISLWGIQKQIFPHTTFFIGSNEESRYLFFPDLIRIKSTFINFLSHTVIAPEIKITSKTTSNGWPMLSFLNSSIAPNNLLAFSANVIWLTILAISAIAVQFMKDYKALRFTIYATILGQLLLHLFYGEELFLYSLHFLPLLLAVISLSLKTAASKIVLPLVILIIPLLYSNNLDKFKTASQLASPPTQQVITK